MKDKKPDKPTTWEDEVWESRSLMERSHISRDTFLHCWCPHCGAGLNEGEMAVYEIVDDKGEVGITKMLSYLNALEQESTLLVDDDDELADVRCVHCHTSLIEPNRVCKEDGCKLVTIHVSVSNSIKLRFTGCIRRSCRWYEMSEEDNERLILRDSHEW